MAASYHARHQPGQQKFEVQCGREELTIEPSTLQPLDKHVQVIFTLHSVSLPWNKTFRCVLMRKYLERYQIFPVSITFQTFPNQRTVASDWSWLSVWTTLRQDYEIYWIGGLNYSRLPQKVTEPDRRAVNKSPPWLQDSLLTNFQMALESSSSRDESSGVSRHESLWPSSSTQGRRVYWLWPLNTSEGKC